MEFSNQATNFPSETAAFSGPPLFELCSGTHALGDPFIQAELNAVIEGKNAVTRIFVETIFCISSSRTWKEALLSLSVKR